MHPTFADWRDLLWTAGVLSGVVVVAVLFHRILLTAAASIARRTRNRLHEVLVRSVHQPMSWIFPLIALLMALPVMPLPPDIAGPVRHFFVLALMLCFAWLSFELMNLIEESLAERYRRKMEESLAARSIRTQVLVMRRIMAA